MKKINIAFVCDFLEIGGQEKKCLNLLNDINKDAFNPTVYSFRGGAYVRNIRDMGIKLYIGSKKDPLSCLKGWTKEDEDEKKSYLKILTRKMKQDSIDIALLFAWPDGVFAANRAQVPVLIEIVDGPTISDKIKDKSAFDTIICESKTIRNLILSKRKELRLHKDRIKVINSGIDLQQFDRNKFNPQAEREKLGIKRDE